MNILQTFPEFFKEFLQKVDNTGIDRADLELDHVAYQAGSYDEYEQISVELEKTSEKLSEKPVGTLFVRIFRLNIPINSEGYSFDIIELVSPREEKPIDISRWEHAEFKTKMSLEEFMEKNSNLDWDTKALDRAVFPMLTLKLDDMTRVKFPRRGVVEEDERISGLDN